MSIVKLFFNYIKSQCLQFCFYNETYIKNRHKKIKQKKILFINFSETSYVCFLLQTLKHQLRIHTFILNSYYNITIIRYLQQLNVLKAKSVLREGKKPS